MKVGSVFGDVVVLETRQEYLKPLDEWHICNVHLESKKETSQQNDMTILSQILGWPRKKDFQMKSHTKLNWPRKNGPSTYFPRAASILSRAATNDETYISHYEQI